VVVGSRAGLGAAMLDTAPLGSPFADPAAEAAYDAGVLTHGTAVTVYGKSLVATQLATRRWQRPVSGVLVRHNGPLTSDQQMWVTLLSGPPGTLLFGLSAAARCGLTGLSPDRLCIVVPGSSRTCRSRQLELPQDWEIHLHWSTRLGPADVNVGHVPPMPVRREASSTRPPSGLPPGGRGVIILAPCQQRLLTPAALWDALSRRGRCRTGRSSRSRSPTHPEASSRCPSGSSTLSVAAGGCPSPGDRPCCDAPTAATTSTRTGPTTASEPRSTGFRTSEVKNWDQDLLRQNDISIAGRGLLVLSPYAVRHLGNQVGDQLERMFRSRGWSG